MIFPEESMSWGWTAVLAWAGASTVILIVVYLTRKKRGDGTG